MQHNSYPIHQSNYVPGRIVSDGELLNGGAEIYDGHLHATSEQISNIAQEYEHESTMGHLALRPNLRLHSPSTEFSSKELEALVDETENTLSLLIGVQDIARPYTVLFSERVPGPSDKDLNWRGMRKPRQNLDSWETTRQLNHTTAAYEFAGSYVPRESNNALSTIMMKLSGIGEKSKSSPAISLGLKYQNGLLGEVDLILSKRRPDVTDHSELVDNETGELSRFLGESRMDRYDGGRLTIAITSDGINISGKSSGYIPAFAYQFRPDKNAFMQTDAKGMGCYPPEISREQFTGMVSDIFAFIPVVTS